MTAIIILYNDSIVDTVTMTNSRILFNDTIVDTVIIQIPVDNIIIYETYTLYYIIHTYIYNDTNYNNEVNFPY